MHRSVFKKVDGECKVIKCMLLKFLFYYPLFLCLETKKDAKKIQSCRYRLRERSLANALPIEGGRLLP